MTVITKLTKYELESFLPQFNLGPLTAYEEIPEGTVNTNYLLVIEERRYVLSLFEHLNLETTEQYLKLTQFLHNEQLPCATPLPNKQNKLVQLLKDKPAAIVKFLPGKNIALPNAKQCHAIGTFLAKMHLCTQSFTPHIENPMNNAWRSHHAHKLMPRASASEQALLQKGLYIQTQIPWRKLPRATVHCDLFRDNALFTQNLLTGVFDFYYACFDAMLLDIAICINDWCTSWQSPSLTVDNILAHAFIMGYQSQRQLNNLEQTQLQPMVQLMAFHFWLTRSTNQLHPPEGPNVTLKVPLEFKIIFEERLLGHAHRIPAYYAPGQ